MRPSILITIAIWRVKHAMRYNNVTREMRA